MQKRLFDARIIFATERKFAMNLWKYGISLFLVLVIVFTGVAVLRVNYTKSRAVDTVKQGKVVIEQETHKWNVCENDKPVSLTMYIRNKGEARVEGNATVMVSLNREGVEEGFITELLGCFDEEQLMEDIRNELEKGEAGRLEAIKNYLERGKKLPEGKSFEPAPGTPEEKSYTFTFMRPLALAPGEVVMIRHDQQVPVGERGGVLSAKVRSIEF